MALAPLLNSSSKQYYWVRETAGEKRVINSRAISNTTGTPNPGPGLEYLPIYREQIVPDYDPRFVVLSTVEVPNEAGDQVNITYTTTDKPAEEVKSAIDNAKRLEVQKHFPLPDQCEAMLIVVSALARQSKGLQLTPQETSAVASIVAITSKITQNKATAEELKEQVELGNKPDIDAAWAAKE